MRNGVDELSQKLLSNIYTTEDLKEVSTILESLSQSSAFKAHARTIATDNRLPDQVKRTQLLYLFKDIDNQILYSFFTDLFSHREFWVFSSKQFDYFDEFVQNFQLATEKLMVVNLVTAVDITNTDLISIAKELTTSLGSQVVIHLQVNPSIIGGAQVRVGNLVA